MTVISCRPGSASAAVAPSSSDGARPGRDPERDQRPVPVRAEPGEQLAELLIGDAARGPLRHPGPEQPGPAARKRLHRIAVRPGTTGPAAVQRERVHHRAGPGLEVEIVKVPQHRLAVRHRRRRVTAARSRLPGDQQPPAEIAGPRPGSPGPTPAPPPSRTGTTAAGPSHTSAASHPTARTPARPSGTRPPADHRTRRVHQLERLPRIARLPEPARQRNRKPRHVQAPLVISHEQGP